MNKLNKILLATMGGIEVVFYTISPILVALMWVKIFSFNSIGDYVIYSAGLVSTIFRGIKIGWMKK